MSNTIIKKLALIVKAQQKQITKLSQEVSLNSFKEAILSEAQSFLMSQYGLGPAFKALNVKLFYSEGACEVQVIAQADKSKMIQDEFSLKRALATRLTQFASKLTIAGKPVKCNFILTLVY